MTQTTNLEPTLESSLSICQDDLQSAMDAMIGMINEEHLTVDSLESTTSSMEEIIQNCEDALGMARAILRDYEIWADSQS